MPDCNVLSATNQPTGSYGITSFTNLTIYHAQVVIPDSFAIAGIDGPGTAEPAWRQTENGLL